MVSKAYVIGIVGAVLCGHFMEVIVERIYTLDGAGSQKG